MEKRKGYSLLRDSRTNKGTAFSKAEREEYGLEGLLPDNIETLETQMLRVNEQLGNFDEPIDKYVYLMSLYDTNETLFFRTVIGKPSVYLPLVYTPTVGEACQRLGHIARRPRGLFISINQKDRIKEILKNWPYDNVRFTVVTDGERILGLGDLGISGIGIPIGKLVLYTSCAGVPPEYTLPIVLDVGTNNEAFLKDPLYSGLKQKRVTGKEYDDFIDAFVVAINEVFPKICIQWEDFAGVNAIRILDRYRYKISTFNDDVQGTAAIATAGFIAISRLMKKTFREQRFLFLGAGAAAFGIANMLVQKFKKDGLSEEEALKRIWMFDVNGLLVKSRTDLAEHQKSFAHESVFVSDFAEAVLEIKPTAIIGVSTVGGAFNQQVIENMSLVNEQPVIFPYSNPTSHSECTAEEAYVWSKGKAIFASGSPFAPVTYEGKTFTPGQGNNVFIFPAMGLAIFATEAKRITDEMLIVAAEAVAAQISDEDFEKGLIYPHVDNILEVSVNVAEKIAEEIFNSGVAGVDKPKDIRAFIKSKMYEPDYK
ncbi:Malate dehydrogenase (oxaloacetate-decarboxylating) (NADP(+)) [Flavobacterium limnosediminis JC2902]|uniref:Malate dehydrogenase (Oxaloacetate-decarboxylating) (NADP(+)) n=1 Tax=Flavobacterium limnosediminis JC2902 TaxID=1341181 RepID=V6SIS2_9FLAO|nr:NAD-dependent malic enzyme [Flavobacterium limnosediminis]ESU26349.1 Malate dehydrogenase (oxaloacetate-decarboxylating) (NADP(+)) [Flavobacterium limnosediminis JC2902]